MDDIVMGNGIQVYWYAQVVRPIKQNGKVLIVNPDLKKWKGHKKGYAISTFQITNTTQDEDGRVKKIERAELPGTELKHAVFEKYEGGSPYTESIDVMLSNLEGHRITPRYELTKGNLIFGEGVLIKPQETFMANLYLFPKDSIEVDITLGLYN